MLVHRRCCIALAFLFLAATVEAGGPEVYLFDPTQIGRGQTLKLVLAEDEVTSVESVAFRPSEGLTVGEIKRGGVVGIDKHQSWTVQVSVAADATTGEREVAVQTPEGLIQKKIEIVAQPIPIISNGDVSWKTEGSGTSR